MVARVFLDSFLASKVDAAIKTSRHVMDEVQFNSSEETLESYLKQLCQDIDIAGPLAITAGNT